MPLRAVHPQHCTENGDDTSDDNDSDGRVGNVSNNVRGETQKMSNDDECNPQSYDLMKEHLLLKSKSLGSFIMETHTGKE